MAKKKGEYYCNHSCDAVAGYRHLEWETDDGDTFEDPSFRGPTFVVNFRLWEVGLSLKSHQPTFALTAANIEATHSLLLQAPNSMIPAWAFPTRCFMVL